MSTRYPGGVITKTPVVPAGPFENGTAPGIWTLDQQLQAQKAGIWPLAGNPVPYIEDVFSTYLYTGNGSTQTITTGVDTGTKGGLIWVKKRSATDDHALFDSVRASGSILSSNLTDAATAGGTRLALTSTGFDLQAGGGTYNQNSFTYASWTFRKQPKFFDVVTYTGTGSNTTIAHNLGSVPGAIWVKRTDVAGDWQCYHRSLANTQYMVLNTTAAVATGATRWNSTTPTSSVFSLGTDATVNASAGTYVAYLFAHDAGGFGLTGTDNVISCGSFTTSGAGTATVNLGYEPQWLMLKNSTSADNWYVLDNMRGFSMSQGISLNPNLTAAESDYFGGNTLTPNATGFSINNNIGAGATWIYVSIRRGPMKVPTSGTSVYESASRTGTAGVIPRWVSGFPVDMSFRQSAVTVGGSDWQLGDRLRGAVQLKPNLTEAEEAQAVFTFDSMTGWSNLGAVGSSTSDRTWMFRRAPGFFDEVCYTGNGSTQTITHNLTVVPELIIAKNRTVAGNNWPVLFNFASTTMNYGFLNLTNSCPNDTYANVGVFSAAPTATSMFLINSGSMNASGSGIVAYLFATVAGVSKVGSYTGTGTTQTINCGFTAGARFVLIKRTDSTGDWYVWDSARGIVAGNDPHLSLNTTAAEVTTDDSVDTDSTGFVVNQVAATNINVTSASYIFLAVS